MSRVCDSTEPNTSVPIIASVPVARLQIMIGNVCNLMDDTTQRKHPDTSMPVPFALRSVLMPPHIYVYIYMCVCIYICVWRS